MIIPDPFTGNSSHQVYFLSFRLNLIEIKSSTYNGWDQNFALSNVVGEVSHVAGPPIYCGC